MKKPLLYVAAALVVLVLVGLVVAIYSIGRIVKNRVETVGPLVTQVDVKLDNAEVWLMPGHVQLKGLTVGNPLKYKSKVSIQAGEISVRMNFLSALSQKTVIDNITIKSPEVTIEGGIKKNNLTDIRDNVESYTTAPAVAAPAANPDIRPAAGPAAKKYQINEIVIQGAKLHVISLFNTGHDMTLPLPDIHLYGLGASAAGITMSETAEKTFTALLDSIAANASQEVASLLGKDAVTKAKKFDFRKAGQKLMKIFGQ